MADDAIKSVFNHLHNEENQLNSVRHYLTNAVRRIDEIEEEIEGIEEKMENPGEKDYVLLSDEQEAIGKHMKELEKKVSQADAMLERVLEEAGTDREALKRAS